KAARSFPAPIFYLVAARQFIQAHDLPLSRFLYGLHLNSDSSTNVGSRPLGVDARCAKKVEQKAAHQSADNSQRDVEPETLALCVDNFASNEPSDQPKYNPADNGHVLPPFELCLETVRHLAAALGKLCHDLLVQPDVHFRRAIESAGVAEFLRQLLAGA